MPRARRPGAGPWRCVCRRRPPAGWKNGERAFFSSPVLHTRNSTSSHAASSPWSRCVLRELSPPSCSSPFIFALGGVRRVAAAARGGGARGGGAEGGAGRRRSLLLSAPPPRPVEARPARLSPQPCCWPSSPSTAGVGRGAGGSRRARARRAQQPADRLCSFPHSLRLPFSPPTQTVVIDARGHMLGRLASVIAKQLLSGKQIVSWRWAGTEQSSGDCRRERAPAAALLWRPRGGAVSGRWPSLSAPAKLVAVQEAPGV